MGSTYHKVRQKGGEYITSAIEFGEFKARLTDIERIHYNRLENLLLNSAIFTLDTQHALVWAMECIEELYGKNTKNE